VIVSSSCRKHFPERNKIIFTDDINHIKDSIIKMQEILSELPKRIDNRNVNYNVENGKVYLNDSLLDRKFTPNRVYTGVLTTQQKGELINLAFYLNKNYLSSAYFDKNEKLWHFIYRDFPERTFNDTRDISILDYGRNISVLDMDTILDHKDNVYLLAPEGAKIR